MAVRAFLQEEKKAAKILTRQCEAFVAHKVERLGVLEDPDVRQELFQREEADTHKSHVLCPCEVMRDYYFIFSMFV